MRVRIFSIRWKILALVASSIVLSMFSVLAVVEIMRAVGLRDRPGFLYNLLQNARQTVGILPLGIAAGFVFFVAFFFFLSRNEIRYLEKISRSVQAISLGRFDAEIPGRARDELGELAGNINHMAARLKASLDEERKAEAAKNELISGVSHDLRTPLTSALGYMELIANKRYRDETELARYAAIAFEKTRRLRKLVDDLFSYTRMSSGGFEFRPARLDLKALLEQLQDEFVPVLREAGMEGRFRSAGRSSFVTGDGDLLARLFENLAANAVRYGTSGTTVEIDLSENDASAVVTVANSGRDIPAADLPHIFERFYRAGAPETDAAGGAGLGLAIAKSIVDLHGGTIAASSGGGRTVFEVRLPLAPADGVLGGK